ncbi:MAG: cystathionine beta-synthase [Candidatus Melainabacteria bacterium]|nr:cystathionine beta-synthase [Candidatus Melainabacteria bacterium]MBI3308716.1 cystathionine beta-synthase [Candidatus Melainabacteria bacterium]
MKYQNSILENIGHTPLIKLSKITKGLKPLILVKAEFFNPGGSVKDRPAIKMIEEAEKEGLLKPGSTIIEPTSGNTGVGVAQAAAVKGYHCILVMPEKMSDEKFALMKAYGAEVVKVPTVPTTSPESYNNVAQRLANEIHNAYMPNQFQNPLNPESHYETTGPEIWEDTAGKVTHFLAGVGTGGTLCGTGKFLKEKNKNVKVIGVDPEGSIYSGNYSKAYSIEGIGEDFIPRNVTLSIIDDFERVSDKDAFETARKMAREEGILAGGSAGAAVCAALRIAKNLSENDVVVVILPDTGRGYLSKIYSDSWMKEMGFLEDSPYRVTLKQLLTRKVFKDKLISISSDSTVREAITVMRKNSISQLPVSGGGKYIGSLSEISLMQGIFDRTIQVTDPITKIMNKPFPELDEFTEAEFAFKHFSLGNPAIIVKKHEKPIGLLTKIDLLDQFLIVQSEEKKKTKKPKVKAK